MKRATVRDLRGDADRWIKHSQHEPVVVSERGRPAALLIGVKGQDWEAIERQTDPGFWQMLGERRAQATVPLLVASKDDEPVLERRASSTGPTSETSAQLLRRLGALLAQARDRQRMSLKAVSERVASETYYGMIERGQRRPSPTTLGQLFRVLSMPPEERREAQRLVEDSLLAASRERARLRSYRAGLVAETPARYGAAPGPGRDEEDAGGRLERLEDRLQQIQEMLSRLSQNTTRPRRAGA